MALALDSDAIIGFLDRSDALHEAARDAVRSRLAGGEERLVVSAVTYAEVLTGALIGRHDETTVRDFFAELVSEVLPADAEIAEAAARLRSRERLRMPDALVLATAGSRVEITALLTGDRDIARVKDAGVRVELLSS